MSTSAWAVTQVPNDPFTTLFSLPAVGLLSGVFCAGLSSCLVPLEVAVPHIALAHNGAPPPTRCSTAMLSLLGTVDVGYANKTRKLIQTNHEII